MSAVRDEARIGPDRRWLITFADLAAVMLAFFVMMFSMSEVDTEKWDGAVNAINRSFEPIFDEEPAVRPQAERNLETVATAPATNLAYLATLLERQVRAKPVLEAVSLSLLPGQLIVSFPRGVLVDDKDLLTPKGRSALFLLSGFLAGLDNEINVIGHARQRPVDDRSPWDYALRRAVLVSEALQDAGYRRPIEALGYGAERQDPVLPPGSRLDVDGRIDVVVVEDTPTL
ncbi:MAG: flagellar motor protein MotB [Alphaproteobacteria bacterium]